MLFNATMPKALCPTCRRHVPLTCLRHVSPTCLRHVSPTCHWCVCPICRRHDLGKFTVGYCDTSGGPVAQAQRPSVLLSVHVLTYPRHPFYPRASGLLTMAPLSGCLLLMARLSLGLSFHMPHPWRLPQLRCFLVKPIAKRQRQKL